MGEEPVSEADFAAAVDPRRARGRAGQPHGRARRPGHAVRGAHRGRLPRAGAPRGGGGRDRGRAGRPLRRHQRDPVEGAGAHLRRARAHALARADGHRHRRGEAGRGARPRDAGGRRARPRAARRWPSASRAERHATLVQAPPPAAAPLRAAGGFQRRNFAVAAAAAEAFLGRALDPEAVQRAAAQTLVPGRAEVVAERAAHRLRRRPQPGRRARAGRVARRGARRPPPARGGDRRARGQGRGRHARGAAAASSTGWCSRARATRARCRPPRWPRWPRSWAARPRRPWPTRARAVARARALAGPDGAVLATGSIYLIADLVSEQSGARASSL